VDTITSDTIAVLLDLSIIEVRASVVK